MLQQTLVESGYILAGCTVYKHAVEDVHRQDGIAQNLWSARVRILQFLAVVLEINTIAIEDGVLGRSDTHHVELQFAALHEVGILVFDLLDELSAYGTHTADEEVQHLVF